ncbi:MAG: hypothetical protein F4Y53_03875 [Proteobacteria bacterium]|nr:hypothetical protein [Pseudomonadota bacterium]
MSTLSNKLVAACMVTAISMVMYGCGGGGGGSSDDEMTMMPPPTTDPTCADDEVLQDGACVPAPPTAEEIAATTKAAGTKRDAIAAEAAQTAQEQLDRGLGGNDGVAPTTSNVANEYNLNIKYGETSIVKEVDGDADNNVTFMQAADLGGGTTMHVLMEDADMDGNVVREISIVTTDIEGPTATAFAMVAGQTLDVTTDTTNDSPDVTNEALAVDETSADVRGLVMSPAFVPGSGSSTQLTFAFDDAGTANMDEAFETVGTYNGADGTYRCNGTADCTVTLNAMGMITAMSDGWIFTPDEGATSDVPDGDYLHYGFWLKNTTDKDGVLTYNEVETFAGSSIAASGSVASVRGTATYSGGATGVYVHSITNPNGTEASATSGHFTADVALTATFGQTTADDTGGADQIPPALLNTLSGTINNFMLSGHDTGPGWSVSLEQGPIDTGAGTATGVTKGGGADGAYSATFHGSTGTDTTTQPSSVVGEFGALFSNGSVAGGFGARKD